VNHPLNSPTTGEVINRLEAADTGGLWRGEDKFIGDPRGLRRVVMDLCGNSRGGALIVIRTLAGYHKINQT